jgi:hypothetical protein
MKIKHINFLCGLPKSGSSLIATILNQHPAVYASPDSALLDGISSMRNTFLNSNPVRNGLRIGSYQKTLWTIPQIFYQDIEKDIIFDRNLYWSTPENYQIATKISTYSRFIICYRPILEVLASFVSESKNEPNFYLNEKLDSSNFFAKNHLSRNDAMAEYLMNECDLISKAILGLDYAKKNEKENIFKFVSYNDLIKEPQKTIKDIFNFMNIESVEIQTKNIIPEIEKEFIKPEDLFSNFILNKYNDALASIGL